MRLCRPQQSAGADENSTSGAQRGASAVLSTSQYHLGQTTSASFGTSQSLGLLNHRFSDIDEVSHPQDPRVTSYADKTGSYVRMGSGAFVRIADYVAPTDSVHGRLYSPPHHQLVVADIHSPPRDLGQLPAAADARTIVDRDGSRRTESTVRDTEDRGVPRLESHHVSGNRNQNYASSDDDGPVPERRTMTSSRASGRIVRESSDRFERSSADRQPDHRVSFAEEQRNTASRRTTRSAGKDDRHPSPYRRSLGRGYDVGPGSRLSRMCDEQRERDSTRQYYEHDRFFDAEPSAVYRNEGRSPSPLSQQLSRLTTATLTDDRGQITRMFNRLL
jgi:hypothetical protein